MVVVTCDVHALECGVGEQGGWGVCGVGEDGRKGVTCGGERVVIFCIKMLVYVIYSLY